MRRSTVALAIGAVLTLDAAVLIQTQTGGPLSFANESHHPVHHLPGLGLPTIPGLPPLPIVNGGGGNGGGNGGGGGPGGGPGGGGGNGGG